MSAVGSQRTVGRLLALALGATLVLAASTLAGPVRIGWSDIVGPEPSRIFWSIRVPRTLLAGLVGAGLSIGGVVFQALFRNPLATPYTLGIDAGAALGAAIGFLSGIGGLWTLGPLLGASLAIPKLALLAFAGASTALVLCFLMSRLRGGQDLTHLLLAGVCISYMSSAGVFLVAFLAHRPITNEIITWTMGSLATLRPGALAEVAVALVPVAVFALYQHRAIDLLALGDQLAASRGVAVQRVVWSSFALVGLLVAVIVANCGPIGFVGLIVPHITRVLVGERALPLLVGSAIVGAGFLAACDAVARGISAYEPPVGIITNILGAAFFFYLLATRDAPYASGR
ncbi:MAG: FecCD family ABC transporter permease [Phycisphaerae bacterium]